MGKQKAESTATTENTVSNFNQKDLDSLVAYLNLVAQKAVLTMNTQETIDHFKTLHHIQSSILPKIEAHIFEPGEPQKLVPDNYGSK